MDLSYSILQWIVVAERFLFILAILSLLFLNWREIEWDRTEKQLYTEQLPGLLKAVREDESMGRAAELLAPYRDDVVRDFILESLPKFETFDGTKSRRLYRQLGFKERDRKALKSPDPTRKTPALRRMFQVIEPDDRELLVREVSQSNHYNVQILGMQLLTQIEAIPDLREILKTIGVYNRLMEEPIDAMMRNLRVNQIGILLIEWEQMESPRIKRVILIYAAKKSHPDAPKYMQKSAKDPEMELRIGACRAAIHLPYRSSAELMIELLNKDSEWEVRAQAAFALGRISIYRALDPLKSAMKDPSFWVRQNAAQALRELGPLGIHELKNVARYSDDNFAVDTANQELEIIQQERAHDHT